MVLNDKSSKLCSYGVQFRNWPGPGEEAAAQFGLSHAILMPPGLHTIFVGGQVGLTNEGVVPRVIAEEVDLAFNHVEKALQAAGLGEDAWEYVYKITTFEVPTPGLMEAIMTKARSVLKGTRPSWTGIGVSSLVDPDLHLEITVEAVLPEECFSKQHN